MITVTHALKLEYIPNTVIFNSILSLLHIHVISLNTIVNMHRCRNMLKVEGP